MSARWMCGLGVSLLVGCTSGDAPPPPNQTTQEDEEETPPEEPPGPNPYDAIKSCRPATCDLPLASSGKLESAWSSSVPLDAYPHTRALLTDSEGNVYWSLENYRQDVHAFSPTGDVRFRRSTNVMGDYIDVYMVDDALYGQVPGDGDAEVMRLSTADGSARWIRLPGEGAPPVTPPRAGCEAFSQRLTGAGVDDSIFVIEDRSCDQSRWIVAVSRETGLSQWRRSVDGDVFSLHATKSGTLIAQMVYPFDDESDQSRFVAWDRSGHELWRTAPVEHQRWTSPTRWLAKATDEALILNTAEVLDPQTGALRFALRYPMLKDASIYRFSTFVAEDTIALHVVQARGNDGIVGDDLHAFELATGTPRWSRSLLVRKRVAAPQLSSRHTLLFATGVEHLRDCAPDCERSPDEACQWDSDGYESTLSEVSLLDGCEVRACPLPGLDPYKEGVISQGQWIGLQSGSWNDCSPWGRTPDDSFNVFAVPGLAPAE